MTGTPNEFGDDAWTPEEREQLASLARERVPPAALKARVVETLHNRNAFATRSTAARGRAAALAAAAVIIFATGTFVGYLAARRSVRPAPAAERATKRTSNEAVANAQQLPSTNQLRYVVWY